MATEVCPKGRKHIGGSEAPVYEKYQIHSPNGAAEIEESQNITTGKRSFYINYDEKFIMEIMINSFHPFGAKWVLFFYAGGFTPCYPHFHEDKYADSPSGLKKDIFNKALPNRQPSRSIGEYA